MKDMILGLGDKFLAIIAVILYLAAIISGLGTMSSSFMLGLMTLIGGIVSVTLLFYFIYVLIDIRDNIRSLNNKEI